jgi:hypothetical protein
MWQRKRVERALFRWNKWRGSLIDQWVNFPNDLSNPSLDELRQQSKKALDRLALPPSWLLELYWICCVVSDYNLDYEESYDRIIVPGWFVIPFPELQHFAFKIAATRWYPPRLLRDEDIRLEARRHGLAIETLFSTYRHDAYSLLLPTHHEFWQIISKLRGRPAKVKTRGRLPQYPDRLAVKCAMLHDSGSTDVEIARKFNLPVKRPYTSEQSDTVRHLVRRGRKLISSLQDSV